MFFPKLVKIRSNLTIKSLIIIGFLSTSAPVLLQDAAAAKAESPPPAIASYADAADLVIGAPYVMKSIITKVQKVKTPPSSANNVPQNYLLLTAQVNALIRGDGGIPPVITFLTADTGDKAFPKKKQEVMLFARPGTKAGEVQLVSRHAFQRWTPDLEAKARAITAEFLKNDSPPAIRSIGDAFHIAGTIAGEGETQIFLKTANNEPISLSVIRRPGQPAVWGVSLGEVVDEAAVSPARDTLLWYRLACGLPRQLPVESVRTLPVLDAEAARRDYALIIESLGRCERTL